MDKIFEGFLSHQYQEGMALAEASDLLELAPLHGSPPQHYVAQFSCKGLTRSQDGRICEATRFEVGIWFPSDYLRHVESLFILTWLNPREIFHPNVSSTIPLMCIGPITIRGRWRRRAWLRRRWRCCTHDVFQPSDRPARWRARAHHRGRASDRKGGVF